MNAKTKLTIVSGNVAAMEAILKDINERIKAAKEGLEWQDADNDERRVNSALGGLSGVQVHIDALKSLADASFCIGRAD